MALIAGPTASGKSSLALSLAESRGGIIINADASQVYRDLRLLSARPSHEEERRAEHRLFGYLDGAIACSAATWAEDAKAEICRAHGAGRLPILVGGTGLYLRTLIEGIAPIPEIDPGIRQAVREMATHDAYDALLREDPAIAARLKPADRTRIGRALEVIRSTGRSILTWREDRTGGIGGEINLRAVVLIPDREWLYERCDRRFDEMIACGAAAEVAALLARGLPPTLPVMRAIGVPELAAHVRNEIDLETAAAAARQATRNYAKRQLTWFRNQPPESWSRAASAEEAAALMLRNN